MDDFGIRNQYSIKVLLIHFLEPYVKTVDLNATISLLD
jgi:hypothetical protein